MIWVVEQAQDAEGVPHFCYHDRLLNLDFVWDGLALEVDVSRDGEVIDRYPLPVGTHSAARNPARWLAHFEIHCQIYIKEKSYEGALARSRASAAAGGGIPDGSGQPILTAGSESHQGGAGRAP